jgi:protein phosphatase
MASLEVGDTFAIGGRDVAVTRVIQQGSKTASYEVEDADERRLLWTGSVTYIELVMEAFADADAPGLPQLVEHEFAEGTGAVLLTAPPMAAAPFTDPTWRASAPELAVRALQDLALALSALHESDLRLKGLRREDLAIDLLTSTIYLIAAPKLRREARPTVESVWRDIRVVGELAYEVFMDDDYPGGHQMAAMLQDRSAIADTGIYFPGLPQVLAGCVSPYGDLAYADALDLWEGLEQLRLELAQPWIFDVGGVSTVGNYIFRKNNQDAFGHTVFTTTQGSSKVTTGFFCVADGIGGIQDGEKASGLAVRTACEVVARVWAQVGPKRLQSQLTEYVRAVAKVVGQRLALEGEFSPLDNRGGTTFSGLLIVDDRAAVCHVGDSRVYLLRDGSLRQLTRDHTLANILVDLGELEPGEEADELSNRTISRFLSTSGEVEWDRIDGFRKDVEERVGAPVDGRGLQVERGDMFILTSDGAHGEIDTRGIERLAREIPEPQALAQAITDHALRQVGRDNSTCLVVRAT